jgi:hypothetical protein
MGVTYIRRFRMKLDLAATKLPEPLLPEGYRWLAWDSRLLDRHAIVKYRSFHAEIDAHVFPCLAGIEGCRRLMREITRQRLFLPDATWLITREADGSHAPEDCGTIQGLVQAGAVGAIQNVGVVGDHRGCGLGRALVLKAIEGYRCARLRHVCLEVTAENRPAVELYRSIGFRLVRTMYKSVAHEPAHSF